MNKKIIIGLGNLGEDYEETRHNIGKEIVLEVVSGYDLKWADLGYGQVAVLDNQVTFFIPKTYMNTSGTAVYQILKRGDFSPIRTLIVRDDLDMELGKVKGVVFRSGAGGHNGVVSIIEELGTNDFGQLKIGIGRPENKDRIDEFVIGKFTKSEIEVVDKSRVEVISRIKDWINKSEE